MILTIAIPDGVKCLLKPSQSVEFDTPFYNDGVTSDATIPVSKKLHISADKIFKYLKKFVGDSINKGEILAEKIGLINSYTIVSDFNGIIKEINHYDGNLILSSSSSLGNQIKAFFKGEVFEIGKNQLKIKIKEGQEFNLKQATDNFGGQTYYLNDSSKPISASQTANKILVIDSITSYLKTKTEALGIKGFITLKNPPQDSDLPKAQIRNIEDFKKVLHLNFPYCLIDKQYSKIYFYR